MKVFIDTNIFLDYIEERPVGAKEANTIFELSATDDIELLVSDLSIANIKYATRKTIPRHEFYRIMRLIRELFTIVPLGEIVVDKALTVGAKDFEDALQYFSAEQAGADSIVTRNAKDFEFPTAIEIIEPKDFLLKYFPTSISIG